VSKLPLTLACLDYDRVKPLMLRQVEPAGIDLNILPYSPDDSVWPMVRYGEFDASEMTLATYAILRTRGEAPYIAIPVFVSRAFPHGAIFVHTKADIHQPQDLKGKRIGSGQFQMSIAVWARGILQHDYGVDPREVHWYTGRAEVGLNLPPDFKATLFPPGKMLADRLEEGELDALIRLFPDPKAIELEYFQRTRIFPMLHLIVIKQEVYDKHPWVASSLYRAFVQAKEICYRDLSETMERLRYTVPWLDSHVEDLWRTMGQDFWPYGLKANTHALETYIQYLSEQHLIDRKPAFEELFARNALD